VEIIKNAILHFRIPYLVLLKILTDFMACMDRMVFLLVVFILVPSVPLPEYRQEKPFCENDKNRLPLITILLYNTKDNLILSVMFPLFQIKSIPCSLAEYP